MIKNLLLTLFAVLCTVFSANAANILTFGPTPPPSGPFVSNGMYTINFQYLIDNGGGSYTLVNPLDDALVMATSASPAVASVTHSTSGAIGSIMFTMAANLTTGATFTIQFSYNGQASSFSSTTLPIELSRFGANVANSNVNLAWETLTETNNEKFLVERSFNGKDFSTIAELAGAGTTLARKNYSFEDKTATATEYKVAYYRLKNVSYDGKASVSQLVAVKLRDANTATITSIAPSKSYMSFTIEENTDVTVSIFNLNGQAITSKVIAAEKGLNQADIDFSNLEQGMYIVNLKTNTSSVSKKFVY